MFVITVIPLATSAPHGTLSYRSKIELLQGSIVLVMLRKKQIRAVVVACDHVRNVKGELKSAHYMLSSSEPALQGTLPDVIITTAEAVAEYHATSFGAVLEALVGESLRAGAAYKASDTLHEQAHKELYVELPYQKRGDAYRAFIEKNIHDGNPVHMIVPTLAELMYWKDVLAEFKPLVLGGTQTPQVKEHIFEKLGTYTGLIITTPTHAWLPLPPHAARILERVSAGSYRMIRRPYLDMRVAVRRLATSTGSKIILGDYPLPLEYRPEPTGPLGGAIPATIRLFDVRTREDDPDPEHWSTIAPSLRSEIRAELGRGGHVVLVASRTGYAPAVVCRDCGQAVTDERGVGLTFTTRKGERLMRSSDGMTVRAADTTCSRCGSWNLYPLGIGVERVYEEAEKQFPGVPVISFHEESTLSKKKILARLAPLATGPYVLVGTEALLPWLQAFSSEVPISLGVLVSADSLLALPFWRSRERFARLGLLLASIAEKTLIGTRKPDNTVFSLFKDEKGAAFFAEEDALRRAVAYPPYGTLLVVQVEGTRAQLEAFAPKVLAPLQEYTPTHMPPRTVALNTFRSTSVVRLSPGVWPIRTLAEALQQISPQVRILLDPESLW